MIKTVLLLLLSALLHAEPGFAQKLDRRSEKMVGLGQVIIADRDLPESVYQAQKYKIVVQVTLTDLKDSSFKKVAMGTGTVVRTGIVLTNKHVLEELKPEMIGHDYSTSFSGIILGEDEIVGFPLYLLATGKPGTFQDFMVLRVGPEIVRKSLEPSIPNDPNPYRVLFRNPEFTNDVKIGTKLYLTGYSPVVAEVKEDDGKITGLYMDFINYTFETEVVARIEEMPVNERGKMERIYRLKDGAEPGFSGGMLLDEKGRLAAITVSLSPAKHFIYALSAKDLQNLLKAHKVIN